MPSHTPSERAKKRGEGNTHTPGPGLLPQPGLEAILAALATGGQPIGQRGKEFIGVNPSEGPVVSALPAGLPGQAVPAQPNPVQAAIDPTSQLQIQAILQALLSGGAGGFNTGGQPVG